MGSFADIGEARKFFENDRFAAANGMTLDELWDGGCLCSVTLREEHFNALGGVMGGVIFTLADFAFAVASNHDHRSTVALDGNIHFLSTSRGRRLTARAERIKSGRTTSVYEITVTDDLGKTVALFVGTGYKLQ